MSSVVPEGWSRHKLGDSLSPRPKSKLPSGESNPLGYYDFYVCSHKVLKSFHNEYSSPSILFSTGGEASVHFATERYAFSTDVWATEFEGDICNEYVFRLLEENIRTINYSGFQGSGIKHLDKSFIEKLEFSIPPLPEQKKIASILTSVDEVIENTQKQIDKLQDLKKATMNELLTKGIGHTEFKDSELGRIPKSWEVGRLGDYIDVLTDYHANGAYEKLKAHVTLLDSPDYAVMIRTTNLQRDDFKDLIYLSKLSYEFLKKSKVYANDILMNKIANPGVSYLMPELHLPVSLGMNLFLIRMLNDVSAKYIFYYLRLHETYVKSFASGTGTETITKQEVKNLKFLLPSFEEQVEIEDTIFSIQKNIKSKELKLSQTQSLKKSLMQDLLTGKVRVSVH
jgi:type I restriction enzyme S subunit